MHYFQFLEINMLELNEAVVSELKKLTKPAFSLGDLLTAAGELKYTREIKRLLGEQLASPSEDFDAASAGYRVGYDNAAHFSREYKRLFGEPPIRNVERLREAATVGSVN